MEAKTCRSQRAYVVKTSPSLAMISPMKAKLDQWGQTCGKPFALGGQRSPPLANGLLVEANRQLGLRLEYPAFASTGESLTNGGEVAARHCHVPALRLHWQSFCQWRRNLG
ncbi:hypothetical protein R1flu_001933 [Riccia fluitans]|uniref:Uncharacterized protein n=1 Tax=Riccia fluitans TaxID=41844 RepID=A0ABD1Y4N6_9MARC